MDRPLEGLRVLDTSMGAAGQQAAGLLADYGADVILVEPPGGAALRDWSPAAAAVFNRGKSSLVHTPSDPVARQRLTELARTADLVVSDMPLEASGLDPAELKVSAPGLIQVRLSGFGADAKHPLPAYEPLIHALLGTMATQAGHREGPIFQGVPFATSGAAQLAVVGLLAALLRRFEDGYGREVETSLWDGALAFHSMLWGESDASLAAGQPAISGRSMGGASRMRLITRSFGCADGAYLGIHTGAVGAFSRLMEVLGLSDRIPPTANGVDMGVPLAPEQAELLERVIHGIFAAHPRDYWVKRLMEADVCAVEHQPPGEVFDCPQAAHNAMVVRLDDERLGPIDQVAPGIRFDGVTPSVRGPAPAPGAGSGTWLARTSVWRPTAPRPEGPDTRPLLDGVKVLDLGAFYAGPYSSRLMADLGADVIKLEPTAGDPLRGIERPFFSAQAGKRSLAVNLKEADLGEAATALIGWADVVHHNMRPGAAERVGMGLAQVRKVNPKAVYLYAPGWGSTGPYSRRQSFAPMLSGYVGGSYEVAGEFNEPLPAVGNEDPGNGLLGAIAVLIALLRRRATGEVLACENPQLNASMGMMAHIVRTADGEVLGATGLDVLQTGASAVESLYETSDGWLCIAARDQTELEGLATATGASLDAGALMTSEGRAAAREVLTDALRTAFAARTTAEWLARLAEHGVPAVEPVGPGCVHALMNDPEERRIGRVAEVVHPEKGRVRELAKLLRVSDAVAPPHRLAPGLGAHNDEILGQFGYAADRIEALRAKGAVRGGATPKPVPERA